MVLQASLILLSLAKPEAAALSTEESIRARLGIPPQAERVLVFGESSHWDVNWLYTAEEYYQRRIRHIFPAVIRELEKEPRRVFSVESLFFLRLFWEREPACRSVLRGLINQRRLRLVGTGVTTPDTLLPDAESILRDYLHGQEWLRRSGLVPEPRIAYLPDNFGHSPALPGLLSALGLDQVGITRLDGMYFIASDYRAKSSFPLSGSSAELLQRDLKTTDFVWRGPDGSEVLCHWNAFSYFQGDMLAHKGIIRWMGRAYGLSWRTRAHVERRVRQYVGQLAPLARTPYLFCPIGCDFNDPLPDLHEMLDDYNQRRFDESGVWIVNAGLDDYLELVDCHRDKLPTLALDPNPYWMGFYASRPEAKLRCNRITRKLLVAEELSAIPPEQPVGVATAAAGQAHLTAAAGGAALHVAGVAVDEAARADDGAQGSLESAWDLMAVSNHHDFITGTSPDRVWLREQSPLLEKAEALADGVLKQLRRGPSRSAPRRHPPAWKLKNGRLEVATGDYRVELAEEVGGCMVGMSDAVSGRSLLTGPANDLVVYRDSGGLWRFGHEYRGGVFREILRASQRPARIEATEVEGLLQVEVGCELAGRSFVRRLWFRADSPIIRMRIDGSAPRRRTVTCRFPTALAVHGLTMDVPGGIVDRPSRKLHRPTFWAARSVVHAHDVATDHGVAAFLGGPACVTLGEQGVIEWVTFRNAPQERAYWLLPVLSHPASGHDPDPWSFEYAVWFTRRGRFLDNRLPQTVAQALRSPTRDGDMPDLDAIAEHVVASDRDDVMVTAVKRAQRGTGVIVRLNNLSGADEVRLRCSSRMPRAAYLCDARERDRSALSVHAGTVTVPLAGRTLVSVRLVFRTILE